MTTKRCPRCFRSTSDAAGARCQSCGWSPVGPTEPYAPPSATGAEQYPQSCEVEIDYGHLMRAYAAGVRDGAAYLPTPEQIERAADGYVKLIAPTLPRRAAKEAAERERGEFKDAMVALEEKRRTLKAQVATLTAKLEAAERGWNSGREEFREWYEKQHRKWLDHLNAHVARLPAMPVSDLVRTLTYVGAVMPGGTQEAINEASKRLTAYEAEVADLTARLREAVGLGWEMLGILDEVPMRVSTGPGTSEPTRSIQKAFRARLSALTATLEGTDG